MKKKTSKKVSKTVKKKPVKKVVKKKASKKLSKKKVATKKKATKKKVSKKVSKKKTSTKKKSKIVRKAKIIIPPPEKKPIQDPHLEGINIPKAKLEELADHFKGIEITEEAPIQPIEEELK